MQTVSLVVIICLLFSNVLKLYNIVYNSQLHLIKLFLSIYLYFWCFKNQYVSGPFYQGSYRMHDTF